MNRKEIDNIIMSNIEQLYKQYNYLVNNMDEFKRIIINKSYEILNEYDNFYDFENDYLNRIRLFLDSRITNDIEEVHTTNVVDDYLSSIRKYKMLDKDQLDKLFIQYNNGDMDAKNKIIESNLRLPVFLAKKYLNCGLSFEDLIQEGNEGLVKAVEGFDVNNGATFSSYASLVINHKIIKALNETGKTIRISKHRERILFMIKDYIDDYIAKNNISPTMDEIINDLKITKDSFFECINFIDPVRSFDEEINEDGLTLEETIGSDINLEEDYINKEMPILVKTWLENGYITDRELYILSKRFGLFGRKVSTLDEIGKELNLTRERVRQIEESAISKLRNSDESILFATFMDNEDDCIAYVNSKNKHYNSGSIRRKFKSNENKPRLHKNKKPLSVSYDKGIPKKILDTSLLIAESYSFKNKRPHMNNIERQIIVLYAGYVDEMYFSINEISRSLNVSSDFVLYAIEKNKKERIEEYRTK